MRCRLILLISDHLIQQSIRIEGGSPERDREEEGEDEGLVLEYSRRLDICGTRNFCNSESLGEYKSLCWSNIACANVFHQFILKSVFEDTIWLQNLLCNAVEFGAAGVLIRDRVTSGGSSRSSSQPPTLHWLNIIAFKPDDLKSSSYHPLWHPKKIFTTRLRTNMQNSDKVYSLEYDTDMLPGSYPHRKYMVPLLGNII